MSAASVVCKANGSFLLWAGVRDCGEGLIRLDSCGPAPVPCVAALITIPEHVAGTIILEI